MTCGELLTLIQINNIASSIKRMHDRGSECACGGIINNMRGVKNEEKIVEAVAKKMGLPVVIHIPRSKTVQDAEFYTNITPITVIALYLALGCHGKVHSSVFMLGHLTEARVILYFPITFILRSCFWCC